MHKDKVEEFKQALKMKHEAEKTKPILGEGKHLLEEVTKIQKLNQELEAQMASLEEKLKASEQKAQENNDKFIRLYAEFDNFRKRSQKEKEELGRFSQEQVIKDILPVLDDLGRALEHAEGSSDPKALIDGVKMVEKHLFSALERFGISTFDSLGERFDPHIHEAMAHEESADYPPDTVVKEYRKGYTMHGKLVRPALVSVSKALPGKSTQERKNMAGEGEIEEPASH